jgi:hypothetical protein
MVPLPTELNFGSGGGYEDISECGLPAAEGSRFGSSCCRRQYFEGTEGETQKISTWSPEVPPPTPTIGGTGWGHATIREAEGGVRRDGSEEAAVERLDLGGDVAANRPSSNAPPRWPPVPNGGALTAPPNWSRSSQRSEGSNRTRRREHRHQACGWQRPGGFRHLKGWESGSLGDAIQTVLSHDGASDFRAGQFVRAETIPRGPPPAPSYSNRNRRLRTIRWQDSDRRRGLNEWPSGGRACAPSTLRSGFEA